MSASKYLAKTALAFFLATSTVAMAAGEKTLTGKLEIDRVLASIPSHDRSMPYKNLGERLPNLGLVVTWVRYGQLEADEVQQSNGLYKKGDVLYEFLTSEPNAVVKAICPISGFFTLVKRGGQWIPNDRTSNFLVNGYTCIAPKSP